MRNRAVKHAGGKVRVKFRIGGGSDMEVIKIYV